MGYKGNVFNLNFGACSKSLSQSEFEPFLAPNNFLSNFAHFPEKGLNES